MLDGIILNQFEEEERLDPEQDYNNSKQFLIALAIAEKYFTKGRTLEAYMCACQAFLISEKQVILTLLGRIGIMMERYSFSINMLNYGELTAADELLREDAHKQLNLLQMKLCASFDEIAESDKKNSIGNEFYKQSKFEEALKLYEEACRIYPFNFKATLNIARINRFYRRFEECGKKIFFVIDNCTEQETIGKAYFLLTKVFIEMNFPSAAHHFLEVIEKSYSKGNENEVDQIRREIREKVSIVTSSNPEQDSPETYFLSKSKRYFSTNK